MIMGKWVTLSLLFLLLAGPGFSLEQIHFESFKSGKMPSEWTTGVTGSGMERWTIEQDVLKQSAVGQFPWCIKNDSSLSDGWAEVKFKLVSGKEDQAGGILFRFKDGNNYYIARANALEKNLTLYHTTDGKRRAFQSVMAEVESNRWHTLRVDFQGSHFTVTFDGKKTLEAENDKIKGAGKVGLWTKNDSVTFFKDLKFDGRTLP